VALFHGASLICHGINLTAAWKECGSTGRRGNLQPKRSALVLAYLDNTLIAQRTDRNILEAFRAKHGGKPIGMLSESTSNASW
jgi:hypothetical protein